MGCGASAEEKALPDLPEEERNEIISRAIKVDMFTDEADAANYGNMRTNPQVFLPGNEATGTYRVEGNIAEIERRENMQPITLTVKIRAPADGTAKVVLAGEEVGWDVSETTAPLQVKPWSRLILSLLSPGRYELLNVFFNGEPVNWSGSSAISERGATWEKIGAAEGSVVELEVKWLITCLFTDELLELNEHLTPWAIAGGETDMEKLESFETSEPRLLNRLVTQAESKYTLPDHLVVRDWDLSNLGIKELPETIALLQVEGNLYLGSNKLRDLPESISYTKALYLDLSDNQLQSIPDDFFAIWGDSACSLNLANNELTTLPASIGQFKVKKLDLSGNKLESLPAEFAGLQCTDGVRLDGQRGSKSTEDLLAGLESNDTLKIVSDIGELAVDIPVDVPEPQRAAYAARKKKERSAFEFFKDFTGVTENRKRRENCRKPGGEPGLRPRHGKSPTTPAQNAYVAKQRKRALYRAELDKVNAMPPGPEKEAASEALAAKEKAGEFKISPTLQAHIDNHWSNKKKA